MNLCSFIFYLSHVISLSSKFQQKVIESLKILGKYSILNTVLKTLCPTATVLHLSLFTRKRHVKVNYVILYRPEKKHLLYIREIFHGNLNTVQILSMFHDKYILNKSVFHIFNTIQMNLNKFKDFAILSKQSSIRSLHLTTVLFSLNKLVIYF